MDRFCNSRSYPRSPLAVSAREEREERALPQVSSEDLKRDSKETVGTAAEYSKQGRNEFSNEAHKDIVALSDGL
jgi:hypothetical protein